MSFFIYSQLVINVDNNNHPKVFSLFSNTFLMLYRIIRVNEVIFVKKLMANVKVLNRLSASTLIIIENPTQWLR